MIDFENTKVKKWLNQFDENDVGLAKSLLNSLIFISNNEFEKAIGDLILDIKKNVCEEKIALIPINDKEEMKPQLNDEDDIFKVNTTSSSSSLKYGSTIGKRYQYNSADRIGQFLTNIERNDPRWIINSPTVDTMRKQKIKNIILVDDIAGSGKRVVDYCKYLLPRSIKSWISSGYTQIWLVLYSATDEALHYINSELTYLSLKNIKTHLQIKKLFFFTNDIVITFLKKYGNKTYHTGAYMGYQSICSNIIFQHGCPNTSPSILWSNSKIWIALFPNRGIPQELVNCFTADDNHLKDAELLWQINQRTLALKLLEPSSMHKLDDIDILIITVLSLLQKRIPLSDISKKMFEPKKKIDEIIDLCIVYGLIEDNKLTNFARDLIKRSKFFKKNNNKQINFNSNFIGNYYPYSLNGFQRKSSD